MDQLSRPYQVALVAIAALALVWAVALRGHGSSSSEPPSASSPATVTHAAHPAASVPSNATASSAAEQARRAAAPRRIYHGPAPGVEGLTRDIAKAHGAVATSQAEARRFEHESAGAQPAAPMRTAAPGKPTAPAKAKAAPGKASDPTSARDRHHGSRRHRSSAGARHRSSAHPRRGRHRASEQATVEHELRAGKTVLLLFWNPKSAVDSTVHSEVHALQAGSKGTVAVHDALPSQVAIFGSLTEIVQVYETPTILIVNRHGVVSTLTGLTDVFALRQAIREARQATH